MAKLKERMHQLLDELSILQDKFKDLEEQWEAASKPFTGSNYDAYSNQYVTLGEILLKMTRIHTQQRCIMAALNELGMSQGDLAEYLMPQLKEETDGKSYRYEETEA